MDKALILLALTIMSFFRCFASDTCRIFFPLGISKVNFEEQGKIDSLVYHGVIGFGKVGIIGYADHLGTELDNLKLSEERARNVKTYLLGLGLKETQIETFAWKGEVAEYCEQGECGNAKNRRVDIIKGDLKLSMPVQVSPSASKPNTSAVKEKYIVYFKPGLDTVQNYSVPVMEALLNALKRNPHLKVRIEGHTCCQQHTKFFPAGGGLGNKYGANSISRATIVYNYLIENGIDKSRLGFWTCGVEKPARSPQKTQEDHELNNRVEAVIIK